jgi:hypothetical protein
MTQAERKALKDAGVEQSVIDAAAGADLSAENEKLQADLKAEQGKSAGILEDKKTFKARAEKAEQDLKKIADEKLPEQERSQKKLKELEEQLETEKKARVEQESNFKLQQREAVLADLTGSIKWASGVPHDTAKLIVKTAMGSLEDLSDKVKVDGVIKALRDSHKSFIAADAPGGTGGKGGGGDEKNTGDKASTMEELVAGAWTK